MPQINILNILQGDNQSAIVDKINYNFDQILSAGGGPQGARGLVGPTGPLGPQGAQGPQGLQGPSGSKWFVQDTAPASGAVTGGNPWTYPTLGDYWIDPDSPNQSIYVLGSTGWINTGFGLGVGSLFQKITPININGGATAQAILFAGATSSDQTLVLSDASIETYTPGGNAINNLNFENSKLKISTKDSRTKLISFGRSDYDTTPGGSGGLSSGNNPYFSWDNSFNPSGASGAGPGFYGISFTNPRGSIGIKSLPSDTSEGGINIISSSEITQQSNNDNISLITQTPNKGTFLSSSNINQGGFFEFSYQPTSTPSNQSSAYMFANSTGLGLGLGTGQFKQSGEDARRLAVNGNASISKDSGDQTASMFIGISGNGNYNKGALYVGGQGGFGATGPTISYIPLAFGGGGIVKTSSTGSSESQNRFPQAWVTSSERGPVLQVRNLGTTTSKGTSVQPRTIIGDGSTEFSLETVTTDRRVSGRYSDISQVAEIKSVQLSAPPMGSGPIFSYQHKIYDSGTTSSNQPVFALTTHVNNQDYSASTYAQKTVIQTLNSNPQLSLQANSSQLASNRVSIGIQNNNLLNVNGSTTNGYGSTTIGASADSYKGDVNPITDSTFPQPNSDYPATSHPKNNHSLVVPGILTIGTNDPESRFNMGGVSQGAGFGGNSMLKINRSNFTGTELIGQGTIRSTGPANNNYANGLEITSYIGLDSSASNANKSVAIAVGASRNILTTMIEFDEYDNPIFSTYPETFRATGFFVANSGENVAIGQYIDDNAALGISGAGSDFALRARGNVGITGSVAVTGTFRTSSSATIGTTLSVASGITVTSGGIQATGSFGFKGELSLTANGGTLGSLSLNSTSKVRRMYVGAGAFCYNMTLGTSDPNYLSKLTYDGFINPPGAVFSRSLSRFATTGVNGYVTVTLSTALPNIQKCVVFATPMRYWGGGEYPQSTYYVIYPTVANATDIRFYFRNILPTDNIGCIAFNYMIVEYE